MSRCKATYDIEFVSSYVYGAELGFISHTHTHIEHTYTHTHRSTRARTQKELGFIALLYASCAKAMLYMLPYRLRELTSLYARLYIFICFMICFVS